MHILGATMEENVKVRKEWWKGEFCVAQLAASCRFPAFCRHLYCRDKDLISVRLHNQQVALEYVLFVWGVDFE